MILAVGYRLLLSSKEVFTPLTICESFKQCIYIKSKFRICKYVITCRQLYCFTEDWLSKVRWKSSEVFQTIIKAGSEAKRIVTTLIEVQQHFAIRWSITLIIICPCPVVTEKKKSKNEHLTPHLLSHIDLYFLFLFSVEFIFK